MKIITPGEAQLSEQKIAALDGLANLCMSCMMNVMQTFVSSLPQPAEQSHVANRVIELMQSVKMQREPIVRPNGAH